MIINRKKTNDTILTNFKPIINTAEKRVKLNEKSKCKRKQ